MSIVLLRSLESFHLKRIYRESHIIHTTGYNRPSHTYLHQHRHARPVALLSQAHHFVYIAVHCFLSFFLPQS